MPRAPDRVLQVGRDDLFLVTHCGHDHAPEPEAVVAVAHAVAELKPRTQGFKSQAQCMQPQASCLLVAVSATRSIEMGHSLVVVQKLLET